MTNKFGFIGNGRFGALLQAKFGAFGESIFVAQKGDSYDATKATWAVIATPSDTHYAIVKECIGACNVFCEKPFVQTLAQAKELYECAAHHIYVDDVFLFRDEFQQLQGVQPDKMRFTWKKTGEFKDTIANDFLYHDLYMLHTLFPKHHMTNIHVEINTIHVMRARCELEHQNHAIFVEFAYNKDFDGRLKQVELFFGNGQKTVDFSNPKNDALTAMIAAMLEGNGFARNKELTLKTVASLEQFQK